MWLHDCTYDSKRTYLPSLILSNSLSSLSFNFVSPASSSLQKIEKETEEEKEMEKEMETEEEMEEEMEKAMEKEIEEEK